MFEDRQLRKLEDGFTGIDQVTAVVPIFSLLRFWAILWVIALIPKHFLIEELPNLENLTDLSFTIAMYALCTYLPIRSCLFLIEVRHQGYKWDHIGLHIKHGYLTRRVSMVPRDRIQRVEVNQSLIQRMLGFGDFSAVTAGSQLNHIRIDNMREKEMSRMRDVVLAYLNERDSCEP